VNGDIGRHGTKRLLRVEGTLSFCREGRGGTFLPNEQKRRNQERGLKKRDIRVNGKKREPRRTSQRAGRLAHQAKAKRGSILDRSGGEDRISECRGGGEKKHRQGTKTKKLETFRVGGKR